MREKTKALPFSGTPKSHDENNKFWLIETDAGNKVYVGRKDLIKYGFTPLDLSETAVVNGLAVPGGKGPQAVFVHSIDGKISPNAKKSDKKVNEKPKPEFVGHKVGAHGAGTIVRLGDETGVWGFIRAFSPRNNAKLRYQDIFFHATDSDLSEADRKLLVEGNIVNFEVIEGSKGPKAGVTEVRLSKKRREAKEAAARLLQEAEEDRKEKAEAKRQRKQKRLMTLLLRKDITVFTMDGHSRTGIPVTVDELPSLDDGARAVVVESFDHDNGPTGVTEWCIVKKNGGHPKYVGRVNVTLERPAQTEAESVETAEAPEALGKTQLLVRGKLTPVLVFGTLNGIRVARAAGLNGGTYATANDQQREKDGAMMVYQLQGRGLETVGYCSVR